jgi:hypothetical protein
MLPEMPQQKPLREENGSVVNVPNNLFFGTTRAMLPLNQSAARPAAWRYSPRCAAPAGGAMMFYTLRKHP